MKNFRKVCRGEKGFTLVELLVVIVILGILAAVAAVSIMRFMSAGDLNAAKTESKNVATAVAGTMWEAGLSVLPASVVVGPSNLVLVASDNNTSIAKSIDGKLKADYTIGTDGTITGANSEITGGWGDKIKWDTDTHNWIKKTT